MAVKRNSCRLARRAATEYDAADDLFAGDAKRATAAMTGVRYAARNDIRYRGSRIGYAAPDMTACALHCATGPIAIQP